MQETCTHDVGIPRLWKKKGCWLTLLLLNCTLLFAQAQNVTGKVTDPDGAPIPGVNILVKGTTIGTTTDVNGEYALSLQGENQVLVFSFIGYASQEISVNNRSVIDISLESDT